MLVLVRYPLFGGLGALGLLALVLLLLSALDGDDDAPRRDLKVEAIRASSAPLIASDLAGFQERRRREGRGYARDTEALLADWLHMFAPRERAGMREWTQYHGVHATATASGFVIETASAPLADGWYRLAVDRRAGRVSATCGGEPAPGCRGGHWRIEQHGLVRSYVLGR